MSAGVDWTPLHAQIHQTLKQRQLLPRQQHLLIAVSGGQDSLCLLRLLLDLQPKWNWTLAVAHCNHRWRPDADANANHVKRLAEFWQLPHYSAIADQVSTSEAAARQWRYQVLTTLAVEQGYTYVITGHTASDRAETLLYNLLRGSGADGLQALSWQRELAANVQLVRPLLGINRAETAAFCERFNLQVWEDSTNQDQKYARNRIRQALIPYLKTHFNPQIEPTLAQTAELLRADVECLENAANALWQQVVEVETTPAEAHSPEGNQTEPTLALNRVILRTAPLALQRRVIRQFLKTTLPIAPSFEHIEKLLALLPAPNRSQTDPFPGGSIAQVEGEWIRLRVTL